MIMFRLSGITLTYSSLTLTLTYRKLRSRFEYLVGFCNLALRVMRKAFCMGFVPAVFSTPNTFSGKMSRSNLEMKSKPGDHSDIPRLKSGQDEQANPACRPHLPA